MLHEHLSEGAKRLLDLLAFMFAGVSVIGLLQGVALVVTIGAGLASMSLAGLRWHDRLKYGPGGKE